MWSREWRTGSKETAPAERPPLRTPQALSEHLEGTPPPTISKMVEIALTCGFFAGPPAAVAFKWSDARGRWRGPSPNPQLLPSFWADTPPPNNAAWRRWSLA